MCLLLSGCDTKIHPVAMCLEVCKGKADIMEYSYFGETVKCECKE